jgi:hypothetical protein
MIHPAPTSKIEPTLARGVLDEVRPGGAAPAMLKLTFPNTNYEMHLLADGPVATPVGKRIIGVVRAKARRVDVVRTGGRFVEPVYGRPRRVQGSIVAVNDGRRSIVVDAGVPIECELTDERQKPADFEVGQFVGFDVFGGATFTPTAG